MRPEIREIIEVLVAGFQSMNLACKKFGDLNRADADALGDDGREVWRTVALKTFEMMPACDWMKKQLKRERQGAA